jgi:SNF2 family DNA or RNA helicase
MGTGKTRAAAEALAAKMHAGELRFAVVLCPKRVMGTWAREIDTWTRGSLRPVILEGATSERARAIRELQETGTVLILNYEALRYPGMMGALIGLLQRAPTALIPDEMHRIRNPSAQQSKLTLKLASLAAWRVGLTGTPVIQGAHDVWSQWYAVDLGQAFGANFVQFRREWFDVNPWTYEVQPRAGAEHAIGERMRARGLRYRKEDCLDLPPKLYETQEVEPTDEQARAYRQMRDELVATLNDPENPATAANQLTAIMRLAQITSGFLPMEDGRVHVFAPNPKLLLLDELLDELLLDNSVIVWCWYRHDVATLRARYARHHPSIIQGGQTSADSEAQMARFQNRQTRLLIANQASGGLGISLTAASVAIYYSQNFSLEHRLQSEDRCHRAGSEIHNRVTYIDLMMRGTVDEVIQQALARKLSVAEMVVDLRRHLGL